MKIQEHIGKIGWTIADKIVIGVFGFISLLQMSMMKPDELGMWGLMASINLWIFAVTTSFGLQGMIQFGAKEETRPKADFLGLTLHTGISMAASLIIFLLRYPLAELFNESRFVLIGLYFPLLTLLTIPRYFVLKYLQRDYRFREYFFVDFVYFAVLAILIFYQKFTTNHIDFMQCLNFNLIGSGLSSLFGMLLIIRELKFSTKTSLKFKEFATFSFPLTINGLIYALPRQLDIAVVQIFFNSSVVGIYYSAKQLYRIFEEAGYAASGLIYPSSVRLIAKGKKVELKALMVKAASFLFCSFLVIVIALNLGLTEILIKLFLKAEFYSAIGQFNLLSLAALLLPFSLMSGYIIAEGKSYIAAKYSFISLIGFFIVLIAVGYSGNAQLIPMGIISFQLIFGIFSYRYVQKNYNYKLSSIFQAIPDSIFFIKKIIRKK